MGLGSLFGKDWTVARNGGLRFVARHPILSEIAGQLASFDLGDLAGQRAAIYVGVHAFTRRLLPPGFRIGIQTEQYLDATGRMLWGKPSRAALLRHVLQYDVLLDLSPQNRPAYGFLPQALQRRLRFGPMIFPDQSPEFRPGAAEGKLLFFGALNPRRQAALAALGDRVRVLPYGTHGTALGAEIAGCRGILNLHFAEGIYTEYPRLLTSLLWGKPLWSDPLAPPLVAGQHYLTMDQDDPAVTGASVYQQCRDDFARQHRFGGFLAAALGNAPAR